MTENHCDYWTDGQHRYKPLEGGTQHGPHRCKCGAEPTPSLFDQTNDDEDERQD